MTAALVTVGLLVLLSLVFIVRPLMMDDATLPERGPVRAEEARDLQGEHEMLLSSLRDLEDDRATGKLRDEDYENLHARLTGRAIEVMKQLDALAEEERRASTPLAHPGAKPPGVA